MGDLGTWTETRSTNTCLWRFVFFSDEDSTGRQKSVDRRSLGKTSNSPSTKGKWVRSRSNPGEEVWEFQLLSIDGEKTNKEYTTTKPYT